jgi:AcrR family transcriptional regulator
MGEREPRERIIRAALARVDRVGLDGLTVREIAGAADVNLAAINYYFGSKARLLEEVLDRSGGDGLWGTLDELRALIEDNRGDIRSGLEEYLSEFLPSLLAHPRRLALRFHGPLREQRYGGWRVRELNDYLEGFLEVVGPALRATTADAQRAAVTQFWGALLGLGLMPRLFEGFTGPHALEGEGLDRWVARLLDHYLTESPAK